MQDFKVGDKVAAPIVVVFPARKPTRSRYVYDIGTVIAVGKHRGTGAPAIKVRFTVSETIWVRKIVEGPYAEKWFLMRDCDKV